MRMSPVIAGICLILVSGVALAGNFPRRMPAPEAVSPGQVSVLSTVAESCPTFHWGEVEGATSYELVAYRVSEEEAGVAEETSVPALQVSLPGSAQGWTPGLDSCLEKGGRYAWSLRARHASGRWGAWSEPRLFRVAPGPTLAEVDEALAVLRRYTASKEGIGGQQGPAPELEHPDQQVRSGRDRRSSATTRGAIAKPRLPARAPAQATPRELGAAAPTLGMASLTLDQQLHLGPESSVFKEQEVFLWGDSDNTALGRRALQSNTTGSFNTGSGFGALRSNTTGSDNTANGSYALRDNTTGLGNTGSGFEALRYNTTGSDNTASGFYALRENTTGSYNTAIGSQALQSNMTGFRNAAIGDRALQSNSTGSLNTASGYSALAGNTTGSRNVAIGSNAGLAASTGDDNILISNYGNSGEGHTIRIGGSTGTGLRQQNRTFIAGIRGITTGIADGLTVVIDSAGQLGTVSSSRRFKEEIHDMAEVSERLLELRPVTFRYRWEVGREDRPLQYGLIAEEVAAIYPELVTYGEDGQPEAVLYRFLSAMLVNELQKQYARIETHEERLEEQERELGELRSRLVLLQVSDDDYPAQLSRPATASREPPSLEIGSMSIGKRDGTDCWTEGGDQ